MVLNKEKSIKFKKVIDNISIKKGILCICLAGTMLLSGCNLGNYEATDLIVSFIDNVTFNDNGELQEVIYDSYQHRVFICYSTPLYNLSNSNPYLLNNSLQPDGYELVDTHYEVYRDDSNMFLVINEYVNTVEVKVMEKINNMNVRKTEFGTPIELTKEDKVLMKKDMD